MPKYTDVIRDAIIANFEAGDQPTAANFAAWILAIQEGIELHDHDGTGDGDGIAALGITNLSDSIVLATGEDFDPADAAGQDLGDATHRWDLYTTDVIFGGATTENEITVPDNIADALGLLDAGGLEFLRIVSTDANPYFAIDPAAAGVFVGIGGLPTTRFTVIGAQASLTLDVDTWGGTAVFTSADATSTFDFNNTAVGGDFRFYATEDLHFRTSVADPAMLIAKVGTVTIANLAGANQPVGADAVGLLYVPHVPSDLKLKENVEPLTGALDVVCALRPVTFDWNKKALADVGLDFGDAGRQVGLISQEVVKVIPDARSDGRKFESYDKGMIMPYLVKAIQELDARLTKGGL